ncbi:DUF4357 domain-containing protein [Lachnospiraceae bacterium 48-33]
MKVFLKTKSGANAVGEFDIQTKALVVKKGSTVSPDIHSSEKFRGTKTIEKYREQYYKGAVTTADVAFKSASTAANFVTGRSTNGLITWKDSDGNTLKSLISE